MLQRFPYENEAWRNYVEQLLRGLCTDRDRLMQVTPQIPDPEAGTPYTGPLSPVAFEFRGGGGPPGSGSAPLSGPGGSGGSGGISGP